MCTSYSMFGAWCKDHKYNVLHFRRFSYGMFVQRSIDWEIRVLVSDLLLDTRNTCRVNNLCSLILLSVKCGVASENPFVSHFEKNKYY